MNYEPPKTIWKVDNILKFNEPLNEVDLRYVSTEKGRGESYLKRFYKELKIDPTDYTLLEEPENTYTIFCGHRGCGKSTELKRFSSTLNQKDLFFVVFLDAVTDLDTNNLQYADVLMGLAEKLFKRLGDEGIEINQVFLKNLENWFFEKTATNAKTKEFALEVKAGLKAKYGIPFFAEIFANITNAFKINTSYKEELRSVIKDSFSLFAGYFNQLIETAEIEIKAKGKGKKILFIVDGTDRLNSEDSLRFFIEDCNQLQLIKSNFIYCAPIHLLSKDNQVRQFFNVFTLPMIKIINKDNVTPFNDGIDVLKDMIYKRADISLFDSEQTVEYLVKHSGGCPRELLKLLHFTFLNTETEIFDMESAKLAVLDLATDYRRFLTSEDYKLLYDSDTLSDIDVSSPRINFLLINLALLEYNKLFRRSHPVIRTLDSYKKHIPKQP
jgi:hypothetical protein